MRKVLILFLLIFTLLPAFCNQFIDEFLKVNENGKED